MADRAIDHGGRERHSLPVCSVDLSLVHAPDLLHGPGRAEAAYPGRTHLWEISGALQALKLHHLGRVQGLALFFNLFKLCIGDSGK